MTEHRDKPEAAERAARQLIGAAIVDPDAVGWADIEPEAMPTSEAVAVWRVLVEYTRAHPGVSIDASTIATRSGVPLGWVVACEGIASEADARHHATTIRQHAERRQLAESLTAAATLAAVLPVDVAQSTGDNGSTVGEALQRAIARVLAAVEPPEASRPVKLADACRSFAERTAPETGAWFPWPGPAEPSLSAGPVMRPENLNAVPWAPWKNLASIAAIGPESVAVLVGPTGRGKTAFALQIALAVASGGHRVLYASAELPADELVARSIACRASGGIPWRAILTAYGDANVRYAAATLAAMPEGRDLYLWTPTGRTRNVDALQLVARQLQARFIVVDYLQRFLDDAEDKRLAVMRASGQLRDLSRKGPGWPGAAVLAVSSIGRPKYEAFSTVDKLRALPADELIGSGKEAGELEYDATLVLAYTTDAPTPGQAERAAIVRVVKQRAGQSEGEAAFTFQAAAGRFTPAELPPRVEPQTSPRRPATGQDAPRSARSSTYE
jgi:replicative DNA helicase